MQIDWFTTMQPYIIITIIIMTYVTPCTKLKLR